MSEDTARGIAINQTGPTPEELLEGPVKKKERLGAWYATAICGNDITSSCLYVSAIAIVYAHAQTFSIQDLGGVRIIW